MGVFYNSGVVYFCSLSYPISDGNTTLAGIFRVVCRITTDMIFVCSAI